MTVRATIRPIVGAATLPFERLGRASLYAGGCWGLPPSPRSERLVDAVRAVVAMAFEGEPESAHLRFDTAGFFAALTRARAALASDANIAALTHALLDELGATPSEFAIDQLRLRGVAPGGHHHPETRDAYALHRDTWYANPQAQINVWVPLRPVSVHDGLSLYPEALRRPLRNDSEGFDYATFHALGGFQSGRVASPATYPRLLEDAPGRAFVSPMRRAGVALFSAAQLHGPTPHDQPETRFSVDVRVVSRLDQRLGRGAPNVDNRSQGDAAADYLYGQASAGTRR